MPHPGQEPGALSALTAMRAEQMWAQPKLRETSYLTISTRAMRVSNTVYVEQHAFHSAHPYCAHISGHLN